MALAVLAATTLSGAQAKQAFTGTITDDMCAMIGHERMRMGPTDAECVKACILSHNAQYVLVAGSEIYELSDQQTPENFAAQRVRVVGTLDPKTRTIRVESIAAAR
jgi:streptogramin lyase